MRTPALPPFPFVALITGLAVSAAAAAAADRADGDAAAREEADTRATPKPVPRGPRSDGGTGVKPWAPLTEAERARAVGTLKAFAGKAKRDLEVSLALHETPLFLVYSDLPAAEVAEWTALLERTYRHLADLFGVKRGQNLWRGKALVFVFADGIDYRRFQDRLHDTDPGETLGMCHCLEDGTVRIASYRSADRETFAHMLVHETVHGFLHRLRTPADVPSWINEGLAEVVADQLLPRRGRAERVAEEARRVLRDMDGLGEMFEADYIDREQYPVAETLAAFLMRQGERRYVNFLLGIKEGLDWRKCLEKHYDLPRDRLLRAYGATLGMTTLRE